MMELIHKVVDKLQSWEEPQNLSKKGCKNFDSNSFPHHRGRRVEGAFFYVVSPVGLIHKDENERQSSKKKLIKYFFKMQQKRKKRTGFEILTVKSPPGSWKKLLGVFLLVSPLASHEK